MCEGGLKVFSGISDTVYFANTFCFEKDFTAVGAGFYFMPKTVWLMTYRIALLYSVSSSAMPELP